MATPASPWFTVRRGAWLIACSGLGWFSAPCWAQVCSGEPAPASSPAPDERFSMIAEQCANLATPLKPMRAAQLDLYDRPAPTIPMSAPNNEPTTVTPGISAGRWREARAPAPSTDDGVRPQKAASRDEARIVSLAPALTQAAIEFGIDPLLLHSVAHVESRHNPNAVSPAGARGMMQMMPATARRFGVGNEHTLLDPNVNLRASAAYLQKLRERFGEDLRLTLAAYNAGEGAVAKYNGVPPYAETQAYVRDVMNVYRRLSSAFSVSRSGQLIARGDK